MMDNHGVVMTAMTFYGDGSYSDKNVDGNGTLTCHFSYNGEDYVPAFNADGYFPADNGDVDGKLTWQLKNNGGVTTEVNDYVPAFNADGYFPADNGDVDGKLTWQLKNNGGVTTEVNGMLTWLLDSDGEITAEMKNMLTCHSELNCEGRVVTDEVNGMLTCESEFNGEVVTDEMLTWQKNKEDEEELAKVLEEASSEMMTCQERQVKIINDYPYWLPLKFQTSSAYVTINGNEELCGSSFSDSDTSYMAGIKRKKRVGKRVGIWCCSGGSVRMRCWRVFWGRASAGHALIVAFSGIYQLPYEPARVVLFSDRKHWDAWFKKVPEWEEGGQPNSGPLCESQNFGNVKGIEGSSALWYLNKWSSHNSLVSGNGSIPIPKSENVNVVTSIGLNSTLSSPDRIGDRSSSNKLLFKTLIAKSRTVFLTAVKTSGTLLIKLFMLVSDLGESQNFGNVKGIEGSSALCGQERTTPIRE
nr:hypothetical protein [Tanacetum cinerariifolium]